MRSCLGVYCVLLALACPETSAKEAYFPPANESVEQVAEDVSLVRLIANPELFDGKMIRTYGYLVLKHEETVLYLSEESAENLILANGVRISFDEKWG